ncbi:MAG: hypothetical protein Q7S87_07095 [Agitococcus sp.]|nr:hypothetical protein [Agitococcus sp.]
MTALDSYHDLTEQGFNFWLEQGALKCHAPKGKMTADILAWLKSHKSELIDLLATNDHYEKIAVENYSHTADDHPHIEEVTPTWRMDRYTQSELHDLLGKDEKELFHHLLECRQCDFEVARYCPEIFTTGRRYDDLLLSFNNAASKREALLNTVIRARISGRKVFVGLDYAN